MVLISLVLPYNSSWECSCLNFPGEETKAWKARLPIQGPGNWQFSDEDLDLYIRSLQLSSVAIFPVTIIIVKPIVLLPSWTSRICGIMEIRWYHNLGRKKSGGGDFNHF